MQFSQPSLEIGMVFVSLAAAAAAVGQMKTWQ
jgi:hypothetical protein